MRWRARQLSTSTGSISVSRYRTALSVGQSQPQASSSAAERLHTDLAHRSGDAVLEKIGMLVVSQVVSLRVDAVQNVATRGRLRSTIGRVPLGVGAGQSTGTPSMNFTIALASSSMLRNTSPLARKRVLLLHTLRPQACLSPLLGLAVHSALNFRKMTCCPLGV